MSVEMKTMTIGETTYEIVDEKARTDVGKLQKENVDHENRIKTLENNTPVSGSGVTTGQSNSLWNVLKKTAFAEALTEEEKTAFKNAWGITEEEPDVPEVTLSSISATYTGGEVTVGTSLTDLTGITVTAHYSDGSTTNVTDYTLSGTIAEGTNTITVSYSGKTTTFTVTGIAEAVDDNVSLFTARSNSITTGGDVSIWTEGYINDSGEQGTLASNYYYDEFIEGSGFAFVNSSNGLIIAVLRLAEYDSNKTFISRKLVENSNVATGNNSPSYIKAGFNHTIDRNTINKILPLVNVNNVCEVENVTIDSSGAEVSYTGRTASKYIPITSQNESVLMHSKVSMIVAFYDSDFALLDRKVHGGEGTTLINIPSNTAYCRICTQGNEAYMSLKFESA